jgi:hypothetical protein
VEQTVIRDQRVLWAFWIAAALAAIGAVAPLSFSIGGHNRLQGVIIPFGIAAVALGINAVMYHQGRSLAATLYFIAGLAIVYGILAMVAVPLRLAVIGTCPPEPAKCPLGFEPPMTSAENNGLALASFCGVLAIFVGFYGLLMLYRRLGVRRRRGLLWPARPPAQPASTAVVTPPPADVAPVETAPVEAAPVEAAPAETAPVAEAPAPTTAAAAAPRTPRPRPRPPAKARPRMAQEPKELEAPDEPKELPAPAEPKELPPPA